jgi:putative hemolysin
MVSTRSDYRCGDPDLEKVVDAGQPLRLPKLFQAYMTLGARVISPPALDRYFKTIDFLVLLDTRSVHMSALDLVQ